MLIESWVGAGAAFCRFCRRRFLKYLRL